MNIINKPGESGWPVLCRRPEMQLDFLEGAVKNILSRVQNSGDAALRELTLQFDQVQLNELRVNGTEVEEAIRAVPIQLKNAILLAAKNIAKFHEAQKREITKIETTPGVVCWRKAEAIQKIGIYIPGGSAPLFSTVLMLGIPAQLAGCREIILCSPPDSNGKINPAILFAANLAGISNIFKVGGAQAIAAMARGTETIPSVYKIFGPGNQYVTKAKQLVNLEGTAIDLP
ncbi:MAG TPA: histidinol dehydrogenase, partial [Cyclobacteriaceae bacterium]|nr:histidinol dehydrogenase [Cyclobacteriaceae bacterium]